MGACTQTLAFMCLTAAISFRLQTPYPSTLASARFLYNLLKTSGWLTQYKSQMLPLKDALYSLLVWSSSLSSVTLSSELFALSSLDNEPWQTGPIHVLGGCGGNVVATGCQIQTFSGYVFFLQSYIRQAQANVSISSLVHLHRICLHHFRLI